MSAQEPINIGEMVMHHAGDDYALDFLPFGEISWDPHAWPSFHVGGLEINLTPTRHVIFMVIAAALVFLTMWLAGRTLRRQRAHEAAPKGVAGAIEGLVLFVRNDIAIANIGHDGAKFAPLILTLFFFILYGNLLGMLPWGAAFTSNLAVTAALAIVSFLVIEISGMIKLGFKGYMGTIFPHFEGLSGPGAAILTVGMAPIEILAKLTKPFALALRLFGNIIAGHFVILSFFGLVFLFGHLPMFNWGIGIATAALVTGIMCLELIVAFLQAYVFALLTSVFIGMMQTEH